jgi:hypothetical protein
VAAGVIQNSEACRVVGGYKSNPPITSISSAVNKINITTTAPVTTTTTTTNTIKHNFI